MQLSERCERKVLRKWDEDYIMQIYA